MKSAALVSTNSIEVMEARRNKGIEKKLDEAEARTPKIGEAVQHAMSNIRPLYRDILEAFAFSDGIEPDAAKLGRELGEKHKGIPIPAVTIRVYKGRAKDAFQRELMKVGIDISKLGGQR